MFIYVTPDEIFFIMIWPVVYISVFLVVIYNIWKDIWRKKATLIFVAADVMAVIYSAVFISRTLVSIVVSVFLLAIVDNLLIYFWRVLND